LGGGEIGLVESLMRAAYPPWLRRATGQRVRPDPRCRRALSLRLGAWRTRRGAATSSSATRRRQARPRHAVPRLFEHALVLQEGRDAGSLAARPRWRGVAGLEAAVDRLVARGDPLSPQPPTVGPRGQGPHAPVHLSARARRAGHHLASRAGHPPTWPSPGTDRHPTPSTRPDPVDVLAHAFARTQAVTT
jgi:hypothetical protein